MSRYLTQITIYIGEGRHFVAEEKLIYPGSKLQKWEALKWRFRSQEVWEGKGDCWTTALHVREMGKRTA